ncbi:MAG: M15 family metallopeptidase [Lachnospiraceae bacterium]|nr:M15 family metallopeptidase [Lachnospiraceae bacterium]
MKRKWKDNLTAKMRQQIKEHKRLKMPITICMILITLLYNIGSYFAYNIKRYASVLVILIFLISCSSFSFLPQSEKLKMEYESEWAEIQENYEYEPTAFHVFKEEVLDDDDVIEGYDNKELDVSADEIDQYSLDDILEANELSKEAGNTYSAKSGQGLSKDDWQLVLVNKQHPVPDDYTMTLGKIKGTMKCDVRIMDDLTDMMQAAQADGIKLVVCSPYRDYNRQTVLFNRKIDYYIEKGHSYMEAYKLASMTVTVPGASEHQIGLALDIVSTTYSGLEIGFGETTAGKWLKEHCDEYGFILRYPAGKEYITGIQYEPWHFRYVGKEAAAEIMERDITLEEFLEELE